jgi:hypothetical protein
MAAAFSGQPRTWQVDRWVQDIMDVRGSRTVAPLAYHRHQERSQELSKRSFRSHRVHVGDELHW